MPEERRSAVEFASRLEQLYGAGLVSVVLYGSVARGEYRAGVSDINLLVILRDLGLAELRRMVEVTRAWVSRGNPPPLLLSEREWAGSADAFPIEYSDIRDAHVVLAGSNPFIDLHIRKEHLRLQLENELRGKKIQLREGFLAMGQSPEELGALLRRSLPTFLTLFRATLRLAGETVPNDPQALVASVATLTGFEPQPVLDVLRQRATNDQVAIGLDSPTAAGYLAAVERTVAWLDGYDSAAAAGQEV
jgi:hypothetical protein